MFQYFSEALSGIFSHTHTHTHAHVELLSDTQVSKPCLKTESFEVVRTS